ncbi:L-lysine 6-transaminase [Saccharopolyspora rectivirgula]|mgnify:CR=1 FL=1|jgi:L-lysine 6-transaminase|uniref:L-lysine-epsilon aminotransferase n=1 Tax=Saccharopolyspora rectivirgula TaxID=28042 RepID=A0A073B2V7_9PSEU|nr:L-lysine 6-transaminase [Saccharopolyspora rectivirgula]KEI45597.1 L-lysine aminotransferase [Saccharopolyspora rectivirgula]
MTAQRESIREPVATAAPDEAATAVETLRASVTGDLMDIVVDLTAGDGCRLRDLRDGTEYLDMTMFFSSAPLGHGHPALRDPEFEAALLAASRVKPSNPDFATVEQARFAETFRRVVGDPQLPLLFFIDGGALAVENALKVAFDWKTKMNARAGVPVRGSRVLHLERAFHGRSGYTLSLTNTDPVKIRDYPMFDWPRIPSPAIEPGRRWEVDGLLPEETAALDAARAALHRYGREIACFVYEPVQGEGGDRHLRPRFLQAVQELCQEHDVLTVADEVQTGGLAGCPWAYQELGLQPDLVAFGKRMQVCGIMGGRRVLEIPDNAFREASRISSTWGGNLVDMVRATRILRTIENENLFAHSRRMGALLLAELNSLVADFPELLQHPRARGLMGAISFRRPEHRDQAIAVARERHRTLFLPSGPDSLRFRPPLTVQATEIGEAVQALRKTLAELDA